MSATGELRAALNAGAAALRRHRPGDTGEQQAALLEAHAAAIKEAEAGATPDDRCEYVSPLVRAGLEH